MRVKKPIFPTDIGNDKDFLYIAWDDGAKCKYLLLDLRKVCPCAICRGGHEADAKPITGRIRRVSLISWKKVGRYALQFFWSDNHSDGFYTYRMLRDFCGDEPEENAGS